MSYICIQKHSHKLLERLSHSGAYLTFQDTFYCPIDIAALSWHTYHSNRCIYFMEMSVISQDIYYSVE